MIVRSANYLIRGNWLHKSGVDASPNIIFNEYVI